MSAPTITIGDAWAYATPANAMPARRPKHTWTPPADHMPSRPSVMRLAPTGNPQPSAHVRRVRRRSGSGWHA